MKCPRVLRKPVIHKCGKPVKVKVLNTHEDSPTEIEYSCPIHELLASEIPNGLPLSVEPLEAVLQNMLDEIP